MILVGTRLEPMLTFVAWSGTISHVKRVWFSNIQNLLYIYLHFFALQVIDLC